MSETAIIILLTLAGQAACVLIFFQSMKRHDNMKQDRFLDTRNPDFHDDSHR